MPAELGFIEALSVCLLSQEGVKTACGCVFRFMGLKCVRVCV